AEELRRGGVLDDVAGHGVAEVHTDRGDVRQVDLAVVVAIRHAPGEPAAAALGGLEAHADGGQIGDCHLAVEVVVAGVLVVPADQGATIAAVLRADLGYAVAQLARSHADFTV